jgi:hypothetical protein
MRILAGLLIIAGALLTAFAVTFTVGFGAITLMGFVGTGGREAGGELLGVLLFGLPALAIGVGTLAAGRALLGRVRRSE